MANFLPFKDSVRRSDFSCKVTRAKPPLRKCAEGFISTLVASTRENFSHSGTFLSASPPKQASFFRLNSSGAEEAGYQQFGCSLPSHVTSATNTAAANRIEGCNTFNIMQAFDGIKGCYHNLINRDWNKTSMPFALCKSFLSTSPTNCRDRCMCDKNWQSQPSFDNMGKCTGSSAPYQRLNGYLNGYVTDMDVNKQLIMDLIGDPPTNCDMPTQLSERVVTEQPSVNCVVSKQAFDPESSSTMEQVKTEVDSHMDETGIEYNLENCGAPAESEMSNEFLAQTMQQRKHKESKKAARRRKRNRGGKPVTSCSATSTAKPFLGNGCVFASALVNGFRSLYFPTDSGYSTQTSLFSDEEDDPSCSIVFSDSSSSVPYLVVDSNLQQQSPDISASTSSLWDDDDEMVAVPLRSHDEDDDVMCSESDEIRQANKRWKACYDDCVDSGHWSDGDCSETRVSFASEALLVTEHHLDDEEEVRKGPWEELARDRQRFQRRVAETASALEPILCPVHRAKVMTHRQKHNTAFESL